MSKRWVYELLLFRLHSLNLETRVASNHVGPVNIYHRGRGGRGGGGEYVWGGSRGFLGEWRGVSCHLQGIKGKEGGGGDRDFFPMKGDH